MAHNEEEHRKKKREFDDTMESRETDGGRKWGQRADDAGGKDGVQLGEESS